MYTYVGKRLKEERNRLGLNQSDFAVLGGVEKRAQIYYEQEARSPDAEYLAAIAKAGADVLYIVTGVRSAASLDQAAEDQGAYETGKGKGKGVGPLSKKEAALLDNYRHSPGNAQDALIETSAAFAQQKTGKIEGKSASSRKKTG